MLVLFSTTRCWSRWWRAGAFAATILMASHVSAAESIIFIDGNTLLTACQSRRAEVFQFCNGSIQAYFDTLSVDRQVCPETRMMSRQIVEIVVRYLMDHPEERHHSAASIARTALSNLFPCKSAQTAKKTPEEVCQAQALASIAGEWSNVLKGQFEIIMKGNRCLVFLQTPAIFEGKRAAWLIEGKTGELLAEFYAPTTGATWRTATAVFVATAAASSRRPSARERVHGESRPDVNHERLCFTIVVLHIPVPATTTSTTMHQASAAS